MRDPEKIKQKQKPQDPVDETLGENALRKGGRRQFWRFCSYYRPHKKLFLEDLFCATIIALIDLVFPMATRHAMNVLLPGGQFGVFFWLIAGLFLLYVLRSAMQYFVTYFGHMLGVRIEATMRRDLFVHMQKLSFGFYDKSRTGQLMSRVTTDLFEISELAHHGPEDLFISILTIVGAFLLMLSLNWKLALVIIVLLPLILWFVISNRRRMLSTSKEVKSRTALINADIESSISGIRVAQAFANEKREIEKFDAGNTRFQMGKRLYYRAMAWFFSGMEFMTNILYVVVLGVGGYLMLLGEMDAATLVAFMLFVNSFLTPIRKLTQFMEQFTAGYAGFERMCDLMDTRPDIEDSPNARTLGSVKGEIRFEGVSFAYDRTKVLKDLDLTVRPGEKLALVGPSGGGKSTLCALIPRFYEPQAGRILVDGQDIRSVTIASLRSQIGIVQQEVFLFADTIRENIRYGRLGATDEEVVEAAKKAEIHEDIMALPNGYDTFVGERGVMLSGGQKQRVSIARIFLKNPPILILDEATSALDTETEIKIQRSLDALAVGRTTLVIAHRLSTIRNADEIVVIDHCGVAERGTHERLLHQNGEYAALYAAQFSVYGGEEEANSQQRKDGRKKV